MTKGNLFARAASRLPWVRRQARKLSHRNALERLKALGFAPATIYDIGAYRAGWSRLAQEVFPQATFILFEANADNAAYLDASGHRHFTVALADADGDKTFFLRRSGDVTGASLYVENTTHYAGENLLTRTVTTARLDSLVRDNALPPADLIKIDVQGAELDVMAGASQTLQAASALIVEVSLIDYNKSAPLITEVMAAIDRAGFRCADLCEVHRTDRGFVLQLDLLFVRPALFAAFCAAAGVAP